MPHEFSESSAARSRLWQLGAAVQTAVLTGEGPSQVLYLCSSTWRIRALESTTWRIRALESKSSQGLLPQPLSSVVDCMRDSGMQWDVDGVELVDASTHIP